MSRRGGWVTFNGTSDVEIDVSVDDVIDAFGRDELLAALGEAPSTQYESPIESLMRDIDLELLVVGDPAAKLALGWVRERLANLIGVAA